MNFEVGDRIICLKAFDNNHDIINKKGTIIKKCDDRYAIEFDEKIRNGHNFILGVPAPERDGRCWNFWFSDEKPITDYLRKINNIKEIIKI